MDIKALLPVLLPHAIDWCERVSAKASAEGFPLKPSAVSDARAVGVKQPERIRLLVVDEIPTPDDSLLATAAATIGFLGSSTAGLALGYAIFVRRGRLSRRLLSHECRHVAQFERIGSLSEFLSIYLNEIAATGYESCTFEVDARSHELPNAGLTWRPI
ncbi:MAG TPA: hypothetical protein VJV79_33470 [Polyangiaceae bacterium]|nr:hypothetical protein [Polyangiaceae bacterium]